MKKESYTSGFTLVELSMVLIVVGLLAAGVVGGQNLIQNAKLQNVVKEIREYDAAITAFKDKFKYYPGDLPAAESYWGTYAAGPPITGATNGNGNWQINTGVESYQFWRQLALAGFISGTYSGAVSGTNFTIGVNAPKSTFSGGGYDQFYNSSVASAFATVGNALEFGGVTGSSGGSLNGEIATSKEGYWIDTKMDDGLATSGNLYVFRSAGYDVTAGKCVSAAQTTSAATYDFTDTTISCRVWWWLDKVK